MAYGLPFQELTHRFIASLNSRQGVKFWRVIAPTFPAVSNAVTCILLLFSFLFNFKLNILLRRIVISCRLRNFETSSINCTHPLMNFAIASKIKHFEITIS